MPRGSKPGERRGGRKKGTPNKRTAQVDAIMSAAIAAADTAGKKYTPLEWLLFVLNDPNTPRRERTEVAKAAAPFCHARLNAIEQTNTMKSHEERLAEMQALLADSPPDREFGR